jgi:hypothetical protein
MADIQYPTSNMTLYDEMGNVVGVLQNAETGLYELHTADDLVLKANKNPHWYQEYGEAFFVNYQATLASKDTEYDIMLITNPNGSGKAFEIDYGEISAVSVSAGSSVKTRLYQNPTITTNGTALTQYNASIGDANTSGINIFTLPTIAARGGLFQYSSSQLVNPSEKRHNLALGVEENNSMLITLEATSNGTSVNISIRYVAYTE